MKKGYKYRIYPNTEQKDLLVRSFGCARFVYNTLLDKCNKEYTSWKSDSSNSRPNLNGYNLGTTLVSLKEEFTWLKEVSSIALQQSLFNLGSAFSSFFSKRGRYPKFKNKHGKQSITLSTRAFRLNDSKLYIAKSNTPINVKWSRGLPSCPTMLTITKETNGHYYVSFVCEYEPIPTNGFGSIGLDMGVKVFYSDSNGGVVQPHKHYRKAERKLGKLQRSLSRKKKGSKNREIAKQKVATLHAKIKHQRNDFLHKLSRQLVNTHKLIAIENLNVKGMIRNRHLSKSISDLGWGTFVNYLTYKTVESSWVTLVKIDRWFPSTQTCSCCGYRLEKGDKLSLNIRFWICPKCKTEHDRDKNAATNIRDEGERIYIVSNQLGKVLNGALLLAQIDVV